MSHALDHKAGGWTEGEEVEIEALQTIQSAAAPEEEYFQFVTCRFALSRHNKKILSSNCLASKTCS